MTDQGGPMKQRYTAKRIFERLREECGFDGGYTVVKDYVRIARLVFARRSFRFPIRPATHEQIWRSGWGDRRDPPQDPLLLPGPSAVGRLLCESHTPDQRLGFCEGGGKRLLTQDVKAQLSSGFDPEGVRRLRRGDVEQERFVGEQGVGEAVTGLSTRQIGIAHHQRRTLQLLPGNQMEMADRTGPSAPLSGRRERP